MNFNLFFNAIQDIVSVDLPGTSSHIKMAPFERVKKLKRVLITLIMLEKQP